MRIATFSFSGGKMRRESIAESDGEKRRKIRRREENYLEVLSRIDKGIAKGDINGIQAHLGNSTSLSCSTVIVADNVSGAG